MDQDDGWAFSPANIVKAGPVHRHILGCEFIVQFLAKSGRIWTRLFPAPALEKEPCHTPPIRIARRCPRDQTAASCALLSLRVLDVQTRKHCFRAGVHFFVLPSSLPRPIYPRTFLLIAGAVAVCLLIYGFTPGVSVFDIPRMNDVTSVLPPVKAGKNTGKNW